jgi:hypothetical protein
LAAAALETAAKRARTALNAYKEDKFDDAFEYLDLRFGGRFPAGYV